MDDKTKKALRAFYLFAATLIAIAACARGIPLDNVLPYFVLPADGVSARAA
jgi:predicted small lipoprotein YifL